ncbi:MAG: hypothetical protein ACXVZR_12850 [Terriglobales bacterium]
MSVNPSHRRPVKNPLQRGIPLHLTAIHSWIEQPRVASRLERDLPRWNQLHSALDALHQTHIAIETYNHAGGSVGEGERLLAIYGLLQALVVQQDALCHLAEALQTRPVRLNRHRRLEEIRNIRNWTVGHPTKADRHLVQSHHAIRRPKLGRGGFALFSAFDDGRTQYAYVPLPQLARLQRRVISRWLRDINAELHQRDQRPPVMHLKPNRVPQVANPGKPNRPAPAGPWQDGLKHKTNGHPQPLHETGNRNGRPAQAAFRLSGNHKHPRAVRTNGHHKRRPSFRPGPRTWMEKTNPPPLLPVRRAARLAAQPMQ